MEHLPFAAPADVFLYQLVRVQRGFQIVSRSAGYELRDRSLVWCFANGRHAQLPVREPLPAAWAESSQRYLVGAEQWLREWNNRHTRAHGLNTIWTIRRELDVDLTKVGVEP
jgi:hypothetical protein